ncbi:MAG TPA: phage portal protein [Mobilitalea sp.]|nr:phage portal protein [Mobilitalea sp.]
MVPLEDYYKGRAKIYTDEKQINYKNVISVLNDALIYHQKNSEQIRFLLNYEKGIQPILDRTKNIRSDINEKVAINNASKITDFKIAYEFGNPITYIQRSKKQVPESDSDKDDTRITALNEMLFEESKSSKDVELARYFKICGIGYRMIKAKPKVYGKSVFDIITLNPATTFIVYSNDIYQHPMMAVTYCPQKDGNTVYGCYTDDTYFEIDNGTKIINGTDIKTDPKWSITNGKGVANIPAIIPIVEYVNDHDRMGCFEKVIPIIDAINVVNSDRVNSIAQSVQNVVWMNNCELPEGVTKLSSDGVLQTKSPQGVQASVQYLDSKIDQSSTQSLDDALMSQLMEIAGVPQRQENSGGGSTGSAMNLSSGWQFAETMALETESIFEQSERQSIRIMLEIIKKSTDISEEFADIVNLNISDIMIRFSRNKIYDMATKCNALSTLIKTGVDPKHAIETVSLFTNPQAVYTDSKDSMEKIQKLLTQPKQTASAGNKDPVSNSLDGNGSNPDKILPDMSDQPQKSPQSQI